MQMTSQIMASSLPAIQLLALANNEQEIVSMLASCLDEQVQLHLLYLDWAENGSDLSVRLAACHALDQSHLEVPIDTVWYARDCSDILDLVTISVLLPNPIWFREGVPEPFFELPAFLRHAQAIVVMRLTGRARVLQAEPHVHAILCFSWPYSHPFNAEERLFFTSIWETLCATVSSCRLRFEALEHVRQLKELDRLKTTFLASVSHEMRTPLNGIISLSTGILGDDDEGRLDQQTRADVDLIYRSAEYLRSMISDVLDYAKLEAAPSSVILSSQLIDLSNLISDVVTLIQRTYPNPDVQIAYTASSPTIIACADPLRVRQVLFNLLTNAVKFTGRGQVEVTAQRGHGQAIIGVRDSGIGIAPEDQAIIFDPFCQLRHSNTRNGIGLGLTICKRLVTLMGGRIWVESKLGQGAHFFFTLPMGT